MSFGDLRKFLFRHKQNNKRVDLQLENGSLLLIKGVTKLIGNTEFQTPKNFTPRINLIFWTVIV